MQETLHDLTATTASIDASQASAWEALRRHFEEAIDDFDQSIQQVLTYASVGAGPEGAADHDAAASVRAAYAASVPYLMLASVTLGGWMMVRMALACERRKNSHDAFLKNKLATALFYGAQVLPRSRALAASVRNARISDQAGGVLAA